MNLDLLVPIVSAVVAAAVSLSVVYLTRRSESIKHLQSLKTGAYVDFIRGVAGLATIAKRVQKSPEQNAQGWDFTVLVADAKSRIAIYGGKEVVSSLASFLRVGSVIDSPERAKAFTEVCQKMRADSGHGKSQIADHDIHFLLFGFDMKEFS